MVVSRELIPVRGGHLAADAVGHGPPVIFLHGGPGDTHHYMRRMAEPLVNEFQCIFFDQRGTGGSHVAPRNLEQFRPELLFDDLIAVQRHFGVVAPSLVGHSWGAMYALYACMRYPDAFKQAALLSMGPLDQEMGQRAAEHLVSVLRPDEKEEWQRLRQLRNTARDRGDGAAVLQADRSMMQLRVKAWIYNPDLREQYLDDYFLDPAPDRDVNKWIWENMDGWFAWDKLRSIRARLWLATGANDSVPIEQSRRVAELAPQAVVKVFDRCGHVPWFEHPEDFFAELRAFLRQ